MNSPLPTEAPISATALLQMGRQPGPFVLALDGQAGPAGAARRCQEVVRAMPGRRLVCRGDMAGGETSLSSCILVADKHWQDRAPADLQALADQRHRGPRCVCMPGRQTRGALHVIVLEAIQPAVTLETALGTGP